MVFEPELMNLNSGAPVLVPGDMYLRRKEILKTLQMFAYGDMPDAVPVTGTVMEETGRCCSGNAKYYLIEIAAEFEKNTFRYPVKLIVPENGSKKPLIVCINFRPDVPDEYIPAEEIIDNGFALAVIYYQDVTNDDADFGDKLASFFPRTGSGHDPGKISLWAWSVSRALDYLLTREDIDPDNIGVIGHSRLGKTALWCAANDERVRYVCSNDSGCMGAAYGRSHHDGGETVGIIDNHFPFWFCDNLHSLVKVGGPLPFDQHFLIAAVAPRSVLINSASKDDWADPPSEQNSCIGASPAWRVYGKTGYAGKGTSYGVDEGDVTGDIGYYKRYGIHFLGRGDWLRFMLFIKCKM